MRHGCPEADREMGAAAGCVLGPHIAAVCLSRLTYDRKPETRTGELASSIGSIEAIEHEWEIRLVKARAVITYAQHALMQVDLDRRVCGAPLAGVIEQV